MKPYRLSGDVTKFGGQGRGLGYPTANIADKSDLKQGVYFGFADLEQYHHHPALIFIGVPTTVGDKVSRVEVHLLDIIDKDYYGQKLDVTLHHFHRPNQHFKSIEQLKTIIQSDEIHALKWFARYRQLAKNTNLGDTKGQ